MSSDIWKIGQETNAQSMYDSVKKYGANAIRFINSDVFAVNKLANICNQMTDAYDEVIDDQNEYLIEIKEDALSVENLKEDINEKIKVLFNEIKSLEQKEKNGTITEEEKKELDEKRGELKTLMSDSDKEINDKCSQVKEKSEQSTQKHKSKMEIARNYGEVTVEKGTPLAETKVKTKSFWRSIFGGTGQDKKDAGDRAVQAGTELLDKVSESAEINTNIENSYKKIKV